MSDRFKKMVLVPEALLESNLRHQEQNVTPIVSQLVNLDKEMEVIMANKKLNDEEKITQYVEVLRRYKQFKQQLEPLPLTIPKPIPTSVSPPHDHRIDLVNQLPKSYRVNALRALTALEKNKLVSIDYNTNELIYDGEKLENTNVKDMLHHTFTKAKKPIEPRGYSTFFKALSDADVPASFLKRLDPTTTATVPDQPESSKKKSTAAYWLKI